MEPHLTFIHRASLELLLACHFQLPAKHLPSCQSALHIFLQCLVSWGGPANPPDSLCINVSCNNYVSTFAVQVILAVFKADWKMKKFYLNFLLSSLVKIYNIPHILGCGLGCKYLWHIIALFSDIMPSLPTSSVGRARRLSSPRREE